MVISALVVGATIVGRPIIGPGCTELGTIADTVYISGAELPRGTAKFYCARDRAGALVRFVLARTTDGQVHSVFDACGQCYRFHKGYMVAGDYLICRLCGNRYHLDEIQKGLASCVPAPMHTQVNGGTIEVKVAEIEKGRPLF
ncbi:MAG TPA: Fe-S-containing protein [Candidatus Binataceae bacterium]|nr:Fe-S-containing protein [Candidatus Binataceae bacterium]